MGRSKLCARFVIAIRSSSCRGTAARDESLAGCPFLAKFDPDACRIEEFAPATPADRPFFGANALGSDGAVHRVELRSR